MKEKTQFPPGYKRWVCDYCTASCNFEGMQWCLSRTNPNLKECPFDRDKPESNGGCFEFMVMDHGTTSKT